MNKITDEVKLNAVGLPASMLKEISQEMFQVPQRETKALGVFEMDNPKSKWVEGTEEYVFTEQGTSKMTARGATDIPLVHGDTTTVFYNVGTYQTAYEVGYLDLQLMNEGSKNLDMSMIQACRRKLLFDLDFAIFIGNDRVKGLNNTAGINKVTVKTNASSKTKWADKKGEEILLDILYAKQTLEAVKPLKADTLLLSTEMYSLLDRDYKDTSSDTIRQVLVNRGWFTRIIEIPEFDKAGDDGKACAFVLDTSGSNMKVSVPVQPELTGTHTKTNDGVQYNFMMRTAGLKVRNPLAVAKLNGACS